MKSKKFILAVMMSLVISAMAGCGKTETQQQSADTESQSESVSDESDQDKAIRVAKEFIQKNEYKKALEALDGVPNDVNTEDLFSKARYGYAKSLYEKGKYADAMEQFSSADGYKDSEEYMEKCVLGKKYEKLEDISDWDEEPGRFLDENGKVKKLTDEEQWQRGENLLASCYQIWYNSETSDNSDDGREMTYNEIDGREYGIISISNEENFKIIWYFLDNPDTAYEWVKRYDTWLHDNYGYDMWIMEMEDGTYQSRTPNEIQALVEKKEQQEAAETQPEQQQQQQPSNGNNKMSSSEIISMCAPYVDQVIQKNMFPSDAYIEFVKWKDTKEFDDALYGHTIQANFEAKRVSANSGAANIETLSVRLFYDFGEWRLRS